MTPATLPLAEPKALWRFRNRTRILRIVLALALLATAITALFFSGGKSAAATPYLDNNSRGVIVLDLSASVEDLTLQRMHQALARFAASKGQYGLVIFSDQAYEALPPGTPAAELVPYAAFFQQGASNTGPLGPSGEQLSVPQFPPNPWATGFSLGTQISQGLDLAQSIVLSSHLRHRDVWLVSDLGDTPTDLPLVRTSAEDYQQAGIALHVIPLNPLKQDLRFFQKLHLTGGVTSIPHVRPQKTADHHHFPVTLAVLGLVLAALLALNELWSRRLDWGPKAVAA